MMSLKKKVWIKFNQQRKQEKSFSKKYAKHGEEKVKM